MGSKELDIFGLIEESGERLVQTCNDYVEDLESRSKELYELVVTENFTVHKVIAESYVTSFTPQSERILEGRSPVYNGGFTSKLTLIVSPDNPIPVNTLHFYGISVVRAGDYISAQIPRYKKEVVSGGLHDGRERTFYFDRDFMGYESAIELALLSEDGKELRRDKAVSFNKFLKK